MQMLKRLRKVICFIISVLVLTPAVPVFAADTEQVAIELSTTTDGRETYTPGDSTGYQLVLKNKLGDSWIRVKLTLSSENLTTEFTDDSLTFTDNWVKRGDYWYYTEKAKAYTDYLVISGMKIQDTDIEGDTGEITIVVDADALQYSAFDPDFSKDEPWEGAEISHSTNSGNTHGGTDGNTGTGTDGNTGTGDGTGTEENIGTDCDHTGTDENTDTGSGTVTDENTDTGSGTGADENTDTGSGTSKSTENRRSRSGNWGSSSGSDLSSASTGIVKYSSPQESATISTGEWECVNWLFRQWKYKDTNGNYAVNGWIYTANPYSENKTSQYDWFHFDENGIMTHGWLKTDDDIWYYTWDKSDGDLGRMVTGWYTDAWDGYTYYFDLKTGIMLSGHQTIDGGDYYFAKPQDTLGQSWFWNTTLGKWIYKFLGLRTYGSMYVSETTPDGYKAGADGILIMEAAYEGQT